MKKALIKQAKSDRIFDFFNHAVLIFALFVSLYPLWFMLIASISDPGAVNRGEVWLLPKDISFSGYEQILQYQSIWTGYKNSIIYTVVGTVLNVTLTIMLAYPLSRKDFYGGKFVMTLLLITMYFSGGLIPSYLLIRSLGMLDTIWALILPQSVVVWNVIVSRTFFKNNIPEELRESAAIDGCGNFGFLIKMVLPLSVPIISVITLFYAVGHWNAFFNALIYLQSESKYPLQLILRDILVLNQTQDFTGDATLMVEKQRIADSIKYGVVIVASVPVLCIYPFIQKYFVKGIMVGSLKG